MYADVTLNSREQRRQLKIGIDTLIASWNWQQYKTDRGRLCCLKGTQPAPPVSVIYSGPVALILVSNDWRNVGVDIEISAAHRFARYQRIAKTLGSQSDHNSMKVLVRAEAWAKATACGFTFGAHYFFANSHLIGHRYDGRVVWDVDLQTILPEPLLKGRLAAVAACADATSPPIKIHAPVAVERLVEKQSELQKAG